MMQYYRVKEERNILYRIKRRKANWIDHILRRNCLLKHVAEGNIEGTGRRVSYWKTVGKREGTGSRKRKQ
jgi:hypothetical protein